MRFPLQGQPNWGQKCPVQQERRATTPTHGRSCADPPFRSRRGHRHHADAFRYGPVLIAGRTGVVVGRQVEHAGWQIEHGRTLARRASRDHGVSLSRSGFLSGRRPVAASARLIRVEVRARCAGRRRSRRASRARRDGLRRPTRCRGIGGHWRSAGSGIRPESVVAHGICQP